MSIGPVTSAILLSAVAVCASLPAVAEEEVIKRWLAANARLTTLEADFTQTRRLASLKAPLRQKGRIWMDAKKDRFRWQLGDPPKTIVIREGQELLILRPGSKKMERRATKSGSGGAALLASGFPTKLEDFRRRFRVVSVKSDEGRERIVTQPLDRSAQGVATLTFVLAAETARLRELHLAYRDGSSQSMVFTRTAAGGRLAENLFQPDLTGYQATTF